MLWELKLSNVSTMNHLNDFQINACALVGCTNLIILHEYLIKIMLSAFLAVQRTSVYKACFTATMNFL